MLLVALRREEVGSNKSAVCRRDSWEFPLSKQAPFSRPGSKVATCAEWQWRGSGPSAPARRLAPLCRPKPGLQPPEDALRETPEVRFQGMEGRDMQINTQARC